MEAERSPPALTPLLLPPLLLAALLHLSPAAGCDYLLPHFTEEVANVTVVQGRDATLKCSVSNLKCSGEHLNNFKVAWVKADTQTLLSIEETMISRNYRLRVSHSDANTWFLHVTKAQLEDRGYYMCQVNTIPMLFRKGYLEVVVPPNIVDGETSGDVEVGEDAPSSLHCLASGYPAPTVLFRRENSLPIRRGGTNGVTVSSETMSQGGTELTKTTLSYSRTGRSDMGHYLCIANNSVPPSVSKRITLSVRFREPEVEVSHQMIGVHLGDDVTINCTVTAFPPPVVFWTHRGGKMIISAGRYQVTEAQVKDSPPVVVSTLSIAGVVASDVTSYTCSATINNDSSRSKSLTVQLNEISRPSTEIPSLDVFYNVPRQGSNQRKAQSARTTFTHADERQLAPTERPPDMFMHHNSNIRHGNLDQPQRTFGNDHGSISQSNSATSQVVNLATLFLVAIANCARVATQLFG